MIKSWKSVSVTFCLSAIMLFGVNATPNMVESQNGQASTEVPATVSTTQAPATTATDKPATPKKQKSVLDAEALDKPFSFFKDLSGSDEDEADMSVRPSAVVLALKALAATLLSTIM